MEEYLAVGHLVLVQSVPINPFLRMNKKGAFCSNIPNIG